MVAVEHLEHWLECPVVFLICHFGSDEGADCSRARVCYRKEGYVADLLDYTAEGGAIVHGYMLPAPIILKKLAC